MMNEEEEENRTDSLSTRSDQSKDHPRVVRTESGASDSKGQKLRNTAESSRSSRLSLKRDWPKDGPPDFSAESGLSGTKEKRRSHERKDPVCLSSSHLDQGSSSGASCYPQCAERSGRRAAQSVGLQQLLVEYKESLRRRYEHGTEGSDEPGGGRLFSTIYTELHIIERLNEALQREPELMQPESASRKESLHHPAIQCQDIFKPLAQQQKHIRVVLTSGVAGSGKTFLVHKFTLDWAEGLENQDVGVLVVLSFRELNLMGEQAYSLLTLLRAFHPTFHKVTAEELAVCKLLFIFDGLDESRLSLDFSSTQLLLDVSQQSSVSGLLTNLIRGNLLPSARVWITSRPAAAHQIPPSCVDRITEVRGFRDAQKEEYFRKRLSDEELCRKTISHIQTSRSLNTMCGLPVFCWVTAAVLEHMLTTEPRGELPQSLNDMYSHFVLVQMQKNRLKHQEGQETSPQEPTEVDGELLLNLSQMDFEHGEKGRVTFRDVLEQCGLDLTKDLLYSVCTHVLLSIQEFLAAGDVFFWFASKKKCVLKSVLTGDDHDFPSLVNFLEIMLLKSLRSQKSHLDLFFRFLYGLTLKSNRVLFGSLLGRTRRSPETTKGVLKKLKEISADEMSLDSRINIFRSLTEMRDLSVHQQIQEFLKSKKISDMEFSETHCVGLAHIIQESDLVMEEVHMKEYNTTYGTPWILGPLLRNCRKAVLDGFFMYPSQFDVIIPALKSDSSHLKHLIIKDFYLLDPAPQFLSAGLESPNCKLETLRLSHCRITETSYPLIFSALKSNPSLLKHLKHLEISLNALPDSAVEHLCGVLESPLCRLETLELKTCWLSETSCCSLVSALTSNPSLLKNLNLGGNQMPDSAVQQLCGLLENPLCILENLGLSGCLTSETSCSSVTSVLKSNPSLLKHLELNGTNCLYSGVEQLCAFLESPLCRLETLSLRGGKLSEVNYSSLTSALKSIPSLKAVDLSCNTLRDAAVEHLCEFLESPLCRLESLRLERCSLSESSCCSALLALKTNPSLLKHLKELDLSDSQLRDSAVEHLCDFLENPLCSLDSLRLNCCSCSDISWFSVASALKCNPSLLKELDLSSNPLPDSAFEQLCGVLQSPRCRLERLRLSNCDRASETGSSSLLSALKSNTSLLRHLKYLNIYGTRLLDGAEMKQIYDLMGRDPYGV